MSLGEQRHDTLERIHLSYCEQITVPAVHFLLQKLTKLTHLSLTGIPAFRHSELQEYCRPPPREFNSTQRAAFCVYSGSGVRELRRYLDKIMPPAGDDRTEGYDSDDDDHDGDVFPKVYLDDSERDEYTTGGQPTLNGKTRHDRSIPSIAPAGASTSIHNPHFHPAFSTSQDTFVQGSSTIPAAHSAASTPNPFGRPISEPQTPTGPFRLFSNVFARSSQSNGHVSYPAVRSTHQLPTHSNSNSARSSQSNGIGFMDSYDPVLMQAAAAVAARNGTATPELVYAELGHGPGASGPGPASLATHLENELPIDEERTYPFSDLWRTHERPDHGENSHRDAIAAATSGARPSSPAFTGVRFPRRGNVRQSLSRSPSPVDPPARANRELEESVHSALSGLVLNDAPRWEEEGRGRRTRLSLRNTLNAAEHYATTFFLNRGGSNNPHGGTNSGGGRNQR
jgi:F-box and leucine-rich repeat protein GRR1